MSLSGLHGPTVNRMGLNASEILSAEADCEVVYTSSVNSYPIFFRSERAKDHRFSTSRSASAEIVRTITFSAWERAKDLSGSEFAKK
jgi:hypothetical protein